MTPFDFSQCPGYCEQIRRKMVMQNHPILSKKNSDPEPSMIPIPEALAMRLEDEEELVGMLASTRAEIKILRDCAGAQA